MKLTLHLLISRNQKWISYNKEMLIEGKNMNLLDDKNFIEIFVYN